MRSQSLLALYLVALSLAGCGDSSSPEATTPPVVTGPIPANLVVSVAAFAFTDADKKAAYDRLNAVRSLCGTGLLSYTPALETAARAHANFVATNYPTHIDAYSHSENSTYPGFTGVTPSDRIAFAGYSANGGSAEVLQTTNFGFTNNPPTWEVDGIDHALYSVYDLARIFGSGFRDIGIASQALASPPGVLVVELAARSTPLQDIGSLDVVTYPCSGSAVRTAPLGIGRETPDPLPGRPYFENPIGQPIYVRVRSGQTLAILSMTVTNTATNVAVLPAAILTATNDPNALLGVNESVFIPSRPLAIGVTYSVVIVGTNNGTAFMRTFSFTTVA